MQNGEQRLDVDTRQRKSFTTRVVTKRKGGMHMAAKKKTAAKKAAPKKAVKKATKKKK
jgi:hypothetical protein